MITQFLQQKPFSLKLLITLISKNGFYCDGVLVASGDLILKCGTVFAGDVAIWL